MDHKKYDKCWMASKPSRTRNAKIIKDIHELYAVFGWELNYASICHICLSWLEIGNKYIELPDIVVIH